MFVGSINQDLRSMVSEVTKVWKTEDIYISCSGNFTIERILKVTDFKMFSNDVSIYTSTIGNYLAGIDDPMTIQQEEYASEFRIGISRVEQKQMKRGYECLVNPEFYHQIGFIPSEETARAFEVFHRKIYRPHTSNKYREKIHPFVMDKMV